MKITLNEIKTDNLRCPDIHLKFKEGLNFVQMPNGTGKTTILTLISYLFSNEWEPRLVKEMQKESTVRAKKDGKIKNLKNGTFTLILTYGSSSSEQKYTYTVDLDFKSGKAKITTDYPGGRQDAFVPPKDIKSYFSKGHANIFNFSADNLKKYFDQNNDFVSNSIKTFSGAQSIENIIKELEKIFNKKHSGINNSKTKKWDKSLIELNKIQRKLEKAKSDAEEEREEIEPEYKEKKDAVDSILEDSDEYKQKKKDLEKNKKDKLEEITLLEQKVSSHLKNPAYFSNALINNLQTFKENLENKKLPGYEAEFFEEVAQDDHCICDTPMTEQMRKNILEGKDKYLGTDQVQTINKIKVAIKTMTEEADVSLFDNEIEELANLKDELSDIEDDLIELETDSSKEQNASKLLAERDKLKDQLDDVKDKIDEIVKTKYEDKRKQSAFFAGLTLGQISSLPWALEDVEKYKTYLNAKRAESGNYEENLKKFELLKSSLLRSTNNTDQKIKDDLTKEINKKIKSSFGREQINVHSLDKAILMEGNKSGGSGGEEAIAVTSFAMSILERSSVNFPMIIDHPVLPIEVESRGSMIKFLNEISHQSICFHINAEKAGFIFEVGSENFRKEIEKANLITTARKTLIKKSDRPDDAETSFNGLVSYDKEFFKDFRIKRDIENV